ncbi:MAG: ABC transporter permease [Armatimonadota bacterium]
MAFEVRLALRHLRAGGWQTVLILGGVAMAVTLVIFVSGLIYGLQQRLISTITGSVAHISLNAPERVPRTIERLPGHGRETLVVSARQQRPWQPDTIDQCRCLEQQIATFDHVVAVAPEVTGQALVTRAGGEKSVRVVGSPPLQQDRIARLDEDLVQGDYLHLQPDQAVIGYELAKELGVVLGDRIRLTTAAGVTQTFRIAGIVYSGAEVVDSATVFVTLRAGQTLFGTGTLLTTFAVKLDDPFQANKVGDAMATALDLEVDTWMRQNPELLSALRAQSGSAAMISVFSLVASGFAIASVLIVSVLKRSKEIGILKAIGARSRQILIVFTLEGLVIGIAGAVVGALIGSAVLLGLQSIRQPVRVPGVEAEPLFPGAISSGLLVVTMMAAVVITVVASILPARQAAKLDPVDVIRGA